MNVQAKPALRAKRIELGMKQEAMLDKLELIIGRKYTQQWLSAVEGNRLACNEPIIWDAFAKILDTKPRFIFENKTPDRTKVL